jgi:DNA (cytosine-5)-methyltransferase 1
MREMARLQTFPDDFVVTGGIGDVQRQLGNAVPSLLAEVLARAVAKQLLGASSDQDELTLALPPAPAVPAAQQVTDVPAAYLELLGEHDPHPGTGKGYRASARELLELIAAE